MKKKAPDKISKFETFTGFLYGLFVLISWIAFISSVFFLIKYFMSFIFDKDFSNPQFNSLCITFVIGTFLVIFVYDEHCRKKFNKK
jgi:hypothetical protein